MSTSEGLLFGFVCFRCVTKSKCSRKVIKAPKLDQGGGDLLARIPQGLLVDVAGDAHLKVLANFLTREEEAALCAGDLDHGVHDLLQQLAQVLGAAQAPAPRDPAGKFSDWGDTIRSLTSH